MRCGSECEAGVLVVEVGVVGRDEGGRYRRWVFIDGWDVEV